MPISVRDPMIIAVYREPMSARGLARRDGGSGSGHDEAASCAILFVCAGNMVVVGSVPAVGLSR